jgi:hypothetical protein
VCSTPFGCPSIQSVEDEERILGVHPLRGATRGFGRDKLFVAHVASRDPVDVGARAAHDDDVPDRELVRGDRLVHVGLERHLLAAAHALVGRDNERRRAILDAARERLRREAAEDDGMDGAHARAGEHRNRGLGDHRHVDRDAIAFLHAEPAQRIAEAADLLVQFPVRDTSRHRRIVALE